MRILLPFISRTGHPIDSPIITGGIEKVAKNLVELFPDEIIPVPIMPDARKNRQTKQIFLEALRREKPDFILTNDIDAYFFDPQISHGIPTVSIVHEPPYGDIRFLDLYWRLQKFVAFGGHLYFVSNFQYRYFDKHIKRITKSPLPKFEGYFNSSFCEGSETVSREFLFDAVTVGRTDIMKNPFFLHNKLSGTGLSSCVITTEGAFQQNPAQINYYNENLHWKDPQFTYRGRSYYDCMDLLSKGKVFISTMVCESWGITALEALARGLPTILVTDASGEHASSAIAASEKHIRRVPSKIKPEELAAVVRSMCNISFEERVEISNATKTKHSRDQYRNRLQEIFEHRLKFPSAIPIKL